MSPPWQLSITSASTSRSEKRAVRPSRGPPFDPQLGKNRRPLAKPLLNLLEAFGSDPNLGKWSTKDLFQTRRSVFLSLFQTPCQKASPSYLGTPRHPETNKDIPSDILKHVTQDAPAPSPKTTAKHSQRHPPRTSLSDTFQKKQPRQSKGRPKDITPKTTLKMSLTEVPRRTPSKDIPTSSQSLTDAPATKCACQSARLKPRACHLRSAAPVTKAAR